MHLSHMPSVRFIQQQTALLPICLTVILYWCLFCPFFVYLSLAYSCTFSKMTLTILYSFNVSGCYEYSKTYLSNDDMLKLYLRSYVFVENDKMWTSNAALQWNEKVPVLVLIQIKNNFPDHCRGKPYVLKVTTEIILPQEYGIWNIYFSGIVRLSTIATFVIIHKIQSCI